MPKSLRIKRIAYGRRTVGNRVLYLLAPTPEPGDVGIAEQVVLYRWRRRKRAGYRFQGDRLNPSAWRAIAEALGADIDEWVTLDRDAIAARIGDWRAGNMELLAAHLALGGPRGDFPHLSIPSAQTVYALLQVCSADCLRQIIARHTSGADGPVLGVPDLFLYTHNAHGKVGTARFVEVKKPKERVSEAQKAEIAFLQSLGLDAQVFRLTEPQQRYARRHCAESAGGGAHLALT